MGTSQDTEQKVRYRYTINIISGIVATHTSPRTAQEVVTEVVKLLEARGIDIDADIDAHLTLRAIEESAAMFRRVLRTGEVSSLYTRTPAARNGLATYVSLREEDAVQQERWLREA